MESYHYVLVGMFVPATAYQISMWLTLHASIISGKATQLLPSWWLIMCMISFIQAVTINSFLELGFG
jgi:hypothetical protein